MAILLSSKEKEALVIDLLDKNYTLRDISKKAHVSFGFISSKVRNISKARKKQIGKDVVACC